MAKLEALSVGASVKGVAGDTIAIIVNLSWYGSNCIEVVYKTAGGRVANDILSRDGETRVEIVQPEFRIFSGASRPGAPQLRRRNRHFRSDAPTPVGPQVFV